MVEKPLDMQAGDTLKSESLPAEKVCQESLPRKFAEKVCRESLPRKFAKKVGRESLPANKVPHCSPWFKLLLM